MIKLINKNGVNLKLSTNQFFMILLSIIMILMLFIIFNQHKEIKVLKIKSKIQNQKIERLEKRIKTVEYYIE
jgi:CRISPR/Cas system-associated protein Csx1